MRELHLQKRMAVSSDDHWRSAMTDSDRQPRMRAQITFECCDSLRCFDNARVSHTPCNPQCDYQGVSHLLRAEPPFVPLLTGTLRFACAVMWISNYFYHASGGLLARSTKLGIALCLLWAVPVFLIDYAGQPIPFAFSGKPIALELIDMLVIGLLAMAMAQQWHRG